MTMAAELVNFLAGTETLGFNLEGWKLHWEPPHEADRSYRARVDFARPFRAAPLVHAAISGFDASNQDAVRINIAAANITTTGFDIVVSTWMDTRLWRVDVNWLAIGQN